MKIGGSERPGTTQERGGRTRERVGPAEPAEAAYSRFARNQVSDFFSVLLTRLGPQGAGRIQSFRAFRRAGFMYATVQWHDGAVAQQ